MPTAFIALGANLPSRAGPPQATLAAAAARLASLGQLTARSSLYSTAPVGVPAGVPSAVPADPGIADPGSAQPRFLNSVIALETSLAPRVLLCALLAIEQEFGRDRSAALRNGPRTLDLDILLYGDCVLSISGLEIPHPRFAQRAFVLIPLHQLAPNLRDPRSGITVSELLRNLPANSPPDAVVPIAGDLWTTKIVS